MSDVSGCRFNPWPGQIFLVQSWKLGSEFNRVRVKARYAQVYIAYWYTVAILIELYYKVTYRYIFN